MCHIAVFVAVPFVGMTLTFEENEHVSEWKFPKSIIIVFLNVFHKDENRCEITFRMAAISFYECLKDTCFDCYYLNNE